MVRSHRSPSMRTQSKNLRVYAPKAACLVLSPSDRTDLAQFCLILLQAQHELKLKKDARPLEVDKNAISHRKIKGSQIRGPYYLKSNLIIKIKLFIKDI